MQPQMQIQTAIKRTAQRIQSGGVRIAESTLPQWETVARPNQIAPHANHPLDYMRRDDWLIWYVKAGRGWGKTLTGAQWTKRMSQTSARIAIVAANFADGRDICVEGETGLKGIIPDLQWNRSMGEMTFPSGAKGHIFSAEEPDRLRGPNNYAAWCDEFSSWRYQKETWDMLMFTLRKGASQTVITTTPKPSPLAKEIQQRPTTIVTHGTTYENIDNLSTAYISNVIKPYEGTTLGRQELEAQDIDDVPGALWTRKIIDDNRRPSPESFKRVVVSLDPATTANDTSDETGLIAAALGHDGHGYVLDDKSLKASPHGWATAAIDLYRLLKADRVIAEANQGGDMVRHTLETIDSRLPITLVHASRGKLTRAEPISALYERGLVHHVGAFPQLEDQMCSWVSGDKSPDRMDALVWALTALMIDGQGETKMYEDNPFFEVN